LSGCGADKDSAGWALAEALPISLLFQRCPSYFADAPSRVHFAMTAVDDFPVAPPLVIKDAPKPRHLKTLKDARDYIEGAMRIGRPEPWREAWRRIKAVTNEEDAIEAIGDLRELLEDEDLLLPSGPGLKA
jgi:hypothetical protein